MGDLPEARVNAVEKVFMKSAVDFAGPIKVKTSTLRNSKIQKGYIAIFVCMATKAVHIEPVCDLTAESFIAALRRLVARRGFITDIFSDNGTNFVKANKILSELSEQEQKEFESELSNEMLKHEVTWHFSPPGSPHFNGLAEAAVKSTKFHLKRAISDTALTFEELATLLCQIESIVNSRPICELSTDPNDTTALTPAHFLNLVPMEMTADMDLSDEKTNWLNRWQIIQKMSQKFWMQWKNEYLNLLQTRKKWSSTQPNIQLGQLVLLKVENLPAAKWLMGRIVELHMGADGLIRVVSVKTKNNILTRAITKIAPLPVNETHTEIKDVQPHPKLNNKKPIASSYKKKPMVLPIITALLAIVSMTFNPVSADKTSSLDVVKSTIEGAITMFNAPLTRDLLRKYTHNPEPVNVEKYNELKNNQQFFNELLQVNDDERYDYKIFTIVILTTIIAMGFIANAYWLMIKGKRRRQVENQTIQAMAMTALTQSTQVQPTTQRQSPTSAIESEIHIECITKIKALTPANSEASTPAPKRKITRRVSMPFVGPGECHQVTINP